MFAHHDDLRFAGKKVTVTVDGVEVDKVTQVMTGKKGFATCYEWPLRVIGDCLMMKQVFGDVKVFTENKL